MDLTTGHQVALILAVGAVFGASRPIFHRLKGVWCWLALAAVVVLATAVVTYLWPYLAHI